MSVFKIPKQIINEIITAISQHWWGDEDQQNICTGSLGGKCAS
jgi:hypothetical protein